MRHLALLAVVFVGACAQNEAPATGKRDYAISDRTLSYSYAGGAFRPIANSPFGMVRDNWNDSPAR